MSSAARAIRFGTLHDNVGEPRRNGVLVNGSPIRGLMPLHDGDRLRVGAQELVLLPVTICAPPSSTEGLMPVK